MHAPLGMQHIVLNNQKYSGPSGWDELSAEMLLHFARITGILGISDMAISILVMCLFKIPYKQYKLLKEFQMLELHQTTAWIFQKNTISKWLLKSVKVGRKTLYGPENKLSNLTGNEFMVTENAYERWLTDQNQEHLNTLFAVLYRKKHWLSGKRVMFNAENLGSYLRETKTFENLIKQAVAINYAGCRNLIIKNHQYIWKQAQDTHNQQQGIVRVTSWATIFLQLAGDKFGTYEQTIKMNLWIMLADLDGKAKMAQEMEAKFK
ncbi:hypothetical protein [Pedobacter sp. NJ-S-72]